MMLYEGSAVRVSLEEDGVATLEFDLADSSVNKFNQMTLHELREALELLPARNDITGLILASAKQNFVVGADINEFGEWFDLPTVQLLAMMARHNETFSLLEQLPFPVVAAINGAALGGGLEVTLAADCRVLEAGAIVGLPEVGLGIFPGWGGTVRLPRIIGLEQALQWILSGRQHPAKTALQLGLAEAQVETDQLRSTARQLLDECIAGSRDWRAQREQKYRPLALPAADQQVLLNAARFSIPTVPEPEESAAHRALSCIEAHMALPLAAAIEIEIEHFSRVVKTHSATNLTRLFLNTEQLKRDARALSKTVPDIQSVLVLGAGIMGGGIAYQSALKGIDVAMKDIQQDALDLGMDHARKTLGQAVKRGKVKQEQADSILDRIQPILDYPAGYHCDVIVEAVVENLAIKTAVLCELEKTVPSSRVLASNTSSISITGLAETLQFPERFCGIHFFNPVHRMPLVEVIRGEQTSDATIASAVNYAQSIGKQAIVVSDCPGFLVNRILFTYLDALERLIHDGVDYQRIDQVMENFGWPMGPAYLLDVIGLDTANHVGEIIRQGYGERMLLGFTSSTRQLFEAGELGQKSGSGYYRFEKTADGKRVKVPNPAAVAIASGMSTGSQNIDDQQIIDRMMIPMAIEAARCLEEGIAGSVTAIDMSLVWGLGFPAFRGGILAWVDSLGIKEFCRKTALYTELGAPYAVTENISWRAEHNKPYYE